MLKRILILFLCIAFFSTSVFGSSKFLFWAITDFSKGQNSHSNNFTTPKTYSLETTNVRTNKSFGSLFKREATVQSVDYGSTSINGLHRYYESDGTTTTLVATSTLLRADFSGTATTIKTGLSDGKRWQFVTYQDMAIGGNDTDQPIKYDGHILTTDNTDAARTASELCAELGAPFAELNTGTTLDASSWYQYKMAWYDDTTYSYSTAVSNPILTGAGVYDINLTDIPIGPEGTTKRYLYRTSGEASQAALSGATYYMVYEITDNSTLTQADTISDATLETDRAPTWATVSGSDDTNATPPICSLWEIHNERLFGSGNTTLKSQIFWGDEYNPDYFDPIDVEEIRPDDGDKVTFLKNQRGVLVVGKTNTIQNWYTTASSDVNWYASDPFSFVGCPAPYSAANTPFGIFYLSWFGIYNYNGQTSALVSDAITDVISDISRADIATTAGFYHENEYHLAYTSDESSATANDREAIYDVIRDSYVIDTKRINCYAAFNSGTDTGILHMGSAITDGWVFKYTLGTATLSVQNKSDLDTGTFTETMSYELSSNPRVVLEFLDLMEEYNDDSLAQAAWVSSDSTETYDSDTKLMLHLDNSVTDDSTSAHTVTNNDITFSSTTKKFGTHAAYLDGDDDYFSIPDHADWNFGASDFTIDAWVMFESAPSGETVFVSQSGDAVVDDWWFGMDDNEINFRQHESDSTTIDVFATWTPALNTWYQVSVARNGSTFRFFVDGTSIVGTNTDATAMADFSHKVYIGAYYTGAAYIKDFNGWIDEVRITKGNARWTANFTSWEHAHGSHSQCYSESANENEGDYALTLESMKTNGLNDTLSKTVTEIDLSPSTHDNILIDVYASRSGTQFQFGIGESGGAFTDNLVNVPVATADTWETVTLDFSGVADGSKNAVIYIGIKVTDADHDNTIIIDNIRPALLTGTWESIVYNIGAASLDKLYWNETLGSFGDITFQARTGGVDPVDGTWTSYTSTAYTDPTGSAIGEAANTYIQVKATLTSSDSEYTPYLYEADGYIWKLTYSAGATNYESSVSSVWQSGWKNFEVEGYKKFIRRIKIFYEGTSGALVFNLKGEEGDIDQSFTIDLSVGKDDDPDDAYIGEGNTKVYTWRPTINLDTSPSPISEWFRFTLTESGTTVWNVDRISIMYQIEEMY